jgi:aminocarboxymuconate-semialdehyde decarboxylase
MLIDLHGHHMSKAMFDLDPHWGPSWEGTLKVGDWFLGTKRLPDLAQATDADRASIDTILDRMGHEFRHQVMEKLGVAVLVVSVPAHMFMYWTGEFGIRFAKVTNDEFAKYCEEDPDHFLWWATLPMAYPEEAAKELERAVEMGAVGFSCGGANFGGLEVHSPELNVLWEKVAELDVPVFIHGYNQSVTWGKDAMSDPFDTTSILGMCYDEARAFWYLVNGGVLDRFPTLKFYITHAGGFTPYQLERFAETNKTMAPDSSNEKPVLDYMGNFWFDPQLHHASFRRAIVDVIGVDRLVYGTNFMGSDQIDFDLTDGIGLSDDDREKIKSGNAIKLLKLQERVAV